MKTVKALVLVISALTLSAILYVSCGGGKTISPGGANIKSQQASSPAPASANACAQPTRESSIKTTRLPVAALPPSTFENWSAIFKSAQPTAIADLTNRDFGTYFSSLPNGYDVLGKFAAHFDKQGPTISTRLSEKEKKAVFGFQLDADGVCDLPTLELRAFFVNSGRMPKGGIELARSMDPAAFSETWMTQLSTKSPIEQFTAFARYVNPITGRIYSSFEAKEWTAGGVYYGKLTGEAMPGDPHYEYILSQKRFDRPIPEVWFLRLYGDEPGEVILEQPHYYYTGQQWGDVPHV